MRLLVIVRKLWVGLDVHPDQGGLSDPKRTRKRYTMRALLSVFLMCMLSAGSAMALLCQPRERGTARSRVSDVTWM